MPYEVGDIVRCRPHWPNKPAFGIWTRDTVLVTEGRIAKVSDAWQSGTDWRYSVQFDLFDDGTFNDCHWSVAEDEIVELWCECYPVYADGQLLDVVQCDWCRSRYKEVDPRPPGDHDLIPHPGDDGAFPF